MGTRPINRTERLASIEQMLFRSPHGLRAVEIAHACGVDRRTVYRDISLLGDIGIPIYQQDGRFFINREQYLANVRLSANEALALFIAARVLVHHADLQNPHLISGIRKISHVLPETSGAHVAFVLESLQQHPVDRAFVVVLETIVRAWDKQRKVRLWYRSSSDSREVPARDFATYFIEPTPKGELHVVGFDMASRRIRALPLRHIKRVKILREHYELPPRFNPLRYLSSAWGMLDDYESEAVDVALAFEPEVTPRIVGRLWHRSQTIDLLDNGGCILNIRVSDWQPLLPWIRSWGAQVTVLAPTPLRRQIAEEYRKLAAVYEDAASSI
ncbi:MAG: WYL domain-containing transcriptional regulator [Chloroflexi bacterium]|nr:MAG: WYL domain-containing transcriptional regulator [Chloroflexota bacterium]